MKKSLIALAALAATGAFAQSSVTLYGRAEAGVDLGFRSTTESTRVQFNESAAGVITQISTPGTFSVNPQTGAITQGAASAAPFTTNVRTVSKPGFRLQDGNDQGQGTSRIGFRGTEDLGGGLKANFVMEMGVRIDEGCVNGNGVGGSCTSGNSGGGAAGTNALFGRAAWVGLSGGFGEVRLGRQVLGSFGVHANGLVAGASSGLYEAGANIVQGGVRFSNAIQYRSPDFGGISGTISLAAPEGKTSTSTTNFNLAGVVTSTPTSSSNPKTGVDLSVAYANGPIYVGFGYNRTSLSSTTDTGFAVPSASTVVGVAENKVTDYAISASYNFGVVQPFFSYVNRKGNGSGVDTTGLTAAIANTASNSKARQYTLGVKVPVGPATLIAAYGNLKTTGNGSSVNVNPLLDRENAIESKQRAFQVGAQYPLSKRTTLQANYGINNTKSVAASANGVANGSTNFDATTSETKVRALNFGVAHAF